MKTVQLDASLCTTRDIRVLKVIGIFVRTPSFCTLDAQKNWSLGWVLVTTDRQTPFLHDLPEPGADKGWNTSYHRIK
jgi:hypothetical protein